MKPDNKFSLKREGSMTNELSREDYEKNIPILVSYLDNLEKNLSKLGIRNYWLCPEIRRFTQINGENIFSIEEAVLTKNVKMYAGKKIAHVIIDFYQNEDNAKLLNPNHTWLSMTINGHTVNEHGRLTVDSGNFGGHLIWKMSDFYITKYTLRIADKLLSLTINNSVYFPELNGITFAELIILLRENNVNIDNLLVPLLEI